MFNAGIDGFEIGLNHFMAEEIRDALDEHPDSFCEHPDQPPIDMDHFRVFSPWDHQSDSTKDDDDHNLDHHLSIGTPNGHDFTHQTTPFSCAVVSQKMILDQFHITDAETGQPFSENRLIFEAATHGWLTQNGTLIRDMPNLMEHHGLSCHHGTGWHSLVDELAAGHAVIMALNAKPLWYESIMPSPLMHLFSNSPNHALVLRGMRVDARDRVVVVVNDPGQRDGAGVEYQFEDFQNAVTGHAFHYVATDEASPGWSPASRCSDLAHSAFESFMEACQAASESPDVYSYVDFLEGMDEDQKHNLMKNL